MDGEQPAILGRFNNVAALHRRQAQVAAHQMGVVPRHKNDFAGPNDEAFSVLIFNSDMKITLDDVVINNQVGRTLPLSNGAPTRTSPARAQAVCMHAPSRFSISVELPIGSSRRDKWPQSRGLPGYLWTSATFPPGITTGLLCGRSTCQKSTDWRR